MKKLFTTAALAAVVLTVGCVSGRPGDDIARTSAEHVQATHHGEMAVEGAFYNNLTNATAANTTFASETPSRAVEAGGLTRDALDGIAGRRPPTQDRTNWNYGAAQRPAIQNGASPPPNLQQQGGGQAQATPPAQGPQLNQPQRQRP